jgi:hypothetical protein
MPMMSPEPAEDTGFYLKPHPSLARRGLAGEALEGFCIDGMLLLHDPASGARIAIAAGEVARVRLGVMGTRSAVYHVARIFPADAADSIQVMSRAPGCLGYAASLRRFAHAVAEARGLQAVEHGLTTASTVATLIAVFLVTGGASALALLVWSEAHGMGGAMAFSLVMALAFGLCVWQAAAHEFPRPMRSLTEIDRYLPRRRR